MKICTEPRALETDNAELLELLTILGKPDAQGVTVDGVELKAWTTAVPAKSKSDLLKQGAIVGLAKILPALGHTLLLQPSPA